MKRITFRRWEIAVDREATARAYERAGREEEICKCLYCRNYYAAGSGVYPEEVSEFYKGLGIDIQLPAEVMYSHPVAEHRHVYGGWFHFVGSIASGPDARNRLAKTVYSIDLEPIAYGFSMGFTAQPSLYFRAFFGVPLVQVEFVTEVDWVLDDPEPDG